MTDIGQWLKQRGLGKYAQPFAESSVDMDVLPHLSETDLKELGLNLGDRRRLEAAIEALSTAAPRPATPPRPHSDAAQAERRQLTVMFCDLVGSTALSESMDPEEYRTMLAGYQSAARKAIERYDGYIARYMGDGLLVYFGYPQAHEEDAERAVRAGLDIVSGLSALRPRDDTELQVRIGIATGLVVAGDIIGEGASEERAVLGDTPNLAARLQGLAKPNCVVLAEATHRLVEGRFELEALGEQSLKGVTAPVQAFRATGVRDAARFDVSAARGLTPLVGRDSELHLLEERWHLAQGGEGQVVLLEGEPGIGKSRLVQALRERVSSNTATALRYQCSPYYANSPFYPVIEQLEHAAGFARADSADVKLTKLEALLRTAADDSGPALPLVASLLSLPTHKFPRLNMTPQKQKAQTILALADQLEGWSGQKPVLMVLEDAHWIDPSTLEMLDTLIDRIQGLRVLLAITYRPEFEPPWTGFGHVTRHSLNRLGERDTEAMVKRVSGDSVLPVALLGQIVAKTDGIPLFAEELTRSVFESGLVEYVANVSPDRIALAIPATLKDSLMARLDRLSPVKAIAQIGACIGRAFSYELLSAVSPLQESELDAALTELTNSELVFRRGTPPEAIYTFKHALVQDTAYESLLISERRRLHARIVQILEDRFPGIVETEPERLAQHYAGAELNEQAIAYWRKAGERAIERSAEQEAAAHLRAGLALIERMPAGQERDLQELVLQVLLGNALMVAQGYTVPEVIAAYRRAEELSKRVEHTPWLFTVIYGIETFQLVAGDMNAALTSSERCLELATTYNDTEQLLISYMVLNNVHWARGEFTKSRDYLERVRVNYEYNRHSKLAFSYNHDPMSCALVQASHNYWALGYPDQARKAADECVAFAKRADHPWSVALALIWGAYAYFYSGDYATFNARVAEGDALSAEHSLVFYSMAASSNRAAVEVKVGDPKSSLERLRDGLEKFQSVGSLFGMPYFRALLADGYCRAGRHEEGLEALEAGFTQLERGNERSHEAELYRIKGDLENACGDPNAAEASYRKAMNIARKQSARSWELRAANSLAQLLRAQGRGQEGYDILAPIYDWFTEGFDTVDLKEAKALLGELS